LQTGLHWTSLPAGNLDAAGLRALGISCVTNAAAGVLDQPLDHNEVLETAERVKSQFIGLLRAVIPRISEAIA